MQSKKEKDEHIKTCLFLARSEKLSSNILIAYLSFQPNGSSRYLKWNDLFGEKETFSDKWKFMIAAESWSNYQFDVEWMRKSFMNNFFDNKLHLITLTSDQFFFTADFQLINLWNSYKWMNARNCDNIFPLFDFFLCTQKAVDKWQYEVFRNITACLTSIIYR